jgi:hypothetical protein
LAQQRFDVSASVYREEDLRKRAPGSTQPDHQAESSAPSVQQGEESVPSSTAKSKSDLEKRAPGTGPSDHQAGSRASPIKVEEEDYPNTETNTTDIMERERKRKKRGDRQTGIPTAPRPWSYIDNYKRLPPTTAHAPGNVPRPSTGHWASRQMGRSQAMFDSPY